MAATICPSQFERDTFLSAPDERDASGVIACWNPDCDAKRWVGGDSVVLKCVECGDAAYEYDVPGGASDEFAAKAEAFKVARKAQR